MTSSSRDLPRTIFVGLASSTVCWYRCALPAIALGADWVGLHGDPERPVVVTGSVGPRATLEDLLTYEVVVLQMCAAPVWRTAIRRLREAGVKVLFEIDDYVHDVRTMADHQLRANFDKKTLAGYEAAMRLADGVIVSTEYLATRYRVHNPRIWVCRNGLDLGRYRLTLPERDDVTVGWAGGTGHREALRPWLPAVAEVMRRRPGTRFATVGQPWAKALEGEFPHRTLAVPFSPLDTYPSAMTNFDVAVAPSGKNGFFRGKSDLRWLEASALGIPLVGDPVVYPEIEHGVTGFHARTPREARDRLLELVDDPALRARMGGDARTDVRERRSIQAMAGQWADVLVDVAAGASVAA